LTTSIKQVWGSRVTTVFPYQGHYAHDPQVLATYPPVDLTIERICDLLNYDLDAFLASKHRELLGKTMKPGKGKEGTSEGEKSWNG